jgi:3,5-dioxohexanoate:acetyl-CoA acetone transferase
VTGNARIMPPRTNKVIISCALTGGIHTPTMSPALPVSPDMLAEQGVAAARAGAAILHVHARDPRDGRPTPDPAAYMAFLPRLKEKCEAIVNVTTGGGLNMTVDDRLQAPVLLRPEMCSLNMGSMNFAIYPLADRYQSWKYEWEEPYLRSTEDFVFKNTFRDIARIVSVLGQEHGCRFEHECYDVGHLYNLAHVVDRKIVQPPFFVQLIFGVLGGIGSDIANLLFMKQTADRLFGSDYVWSVLAAGRQQMPFAAQSVLLGGSVRVGLEDSLFIGPGALAGSNAEQVVKVRSIVETLGYEIATPADVRQLLGLKGASAVGF